jgi:hypothetical protein
MTKKKVTPPDNLYRVKVHTDWRYGKHAKFWDIEKFNQEASDRHGEPVYFTACKGGLAYTNIGLWRTIRRRLKKMKVGYSTTYYGLDGKVIE